MTEHTTGLTPRITLAMLHGACREQRAIFRAEWPEGADVTLENVRRAQELGLTLTWGEQWFTDPALKAYDEAIAPSWKVFLEARGTAEEAYDEAIAQARKAYLEATATAWVAAYIASVAEREAAK